MTTEQAQRPLDLAELRKVAKALRDRHRLAFKIGGVTMGDDLLNQAATMLDALLDRVEQAEAERDAALRRLDLWLKATDA